MKLYFNRRFAEHGSMLGDGEMEIMKIILSPQRREDTLKIVKQGATLFINDEAFSFSRMGDGDTLPREAIKSEWFAGPVEKLNGELIVTLVMPNPWNYSHDQAFPEPISDVPDGVVDLPKPLPELPDFFGQGVTD